MAPILLASICTHTREHTELDLDVALLDLGMDGERVGRLHSGLKPGSYRWGLVLCQPQPTSTHLGLINLLLRGCGSQPNITQVFRQTIL